MPHGTKVDDIYQALKKKGMDSGKAARIAQSKSGESLATGKPVKRAAGADIVGKQPQETKTAKPTSPAYCPHCSHVLLDNGTCPTCSRKRSDRSIRPAGS